MSSLLRVEYLPFPVDRILESKISIHFSQDEEEKKMLSVKRPVITVVEYTTKPVFPSPTMMGVCGPDLERATLDALAVAFPFRVTV